MSYPVDAQSLPRGASPASLPARSGIGLKSAHVGEILQTLPELGFFEVHAENYMVDGGPFHQHLERICAHYPLSIHGVGMSIGAEGPLDDCHLDAMAALLERYQPASFSEHLAWSSHGGVFLNDLLPLPYTGRTLQRVCEHIDQVQTRLGRRMLLENPATYLQFAESTWDEAAFITEVLQRTGCGLLLDVNNVYVSSVNHHFDAQAYLRALPLNLVGEIHLAGFAEQRDGAGDPLLIDHHGAPVDAAVWALYDYALGLTGPVATLIERDNDLPALPVLLAEAGRAEYRLHTIQVPA
jgi:uncharacterized protein (UPF0276 family)